jgi:hypothetical protein
MEQLSTYRAKGNKGELVLLFKYDLIGNLMAFEVSESELSPEQWQWLFSDRFPAHESIILNVWMKEELYLKFFTIVKSPADISFEAAWTLYNHKISKQDAQKAFKKMSEAEIIQFFVSIPNYEGYLKKTKVSKANMERYINGKYWENEYPEIVGKRNYNPVLKDLAKLKTSK